MGVDPQGVGGCPPKGGEHYSGVLFVYSHSTVLRILCKILFVCSVYSVCLLFICLLTFCIVGLFCLFTVCSVYSHSVQCLFILFVYCLYCLFICLSRLSEHSVLFVYLFVTLE